MKLLIIALMAFVIYNLFSGLFYLVADKGQTTRTVKALSIRIIFSLGIFFLLIIGFRFGIINPHLV